jgi:hypothetical protein
LPRITGIVQTSPKRSRCLNWVKSRRFAPPLTTSGLTRTADITHRDHHFRKVPISDGTAGLGYVSVGRPVQFEITEQTRDTVGRRIQGADLRPGGVLFPSRTVAHAVGVTP